MIVSMDAKGLREFRADVTGAAKATEAQVRPVVSKGALNIKKQLQREMSGSRSFKGVSRAINYDIEVTASFVEAEIGPSADPGSPGNLANIAYFGGARGGGTVPDPVGALRAEAPRFEKALADVLGDLL